MSFDYRSKKWKRVAQEAQRRAGWKCQCCDRSPAQLAAKGYYLVVHHRLDANLYPQYQFDVRFLSTVCTECHDAIHGRLPPAPVEQAAIQTDWINDLGAPTLQDIEDMGLFERADRRRAAEVRAAEIQFCKDEYDQSRARAETRDATEQRGRELEHGVLEEYERLRSLAPDIGKENDGITITKTPNSGRRGPA